MLLLWRQTLFQGILTLKNVLFIQTQILVDQVHFGYSFGKLSECFRHVFAPLWIFFFRNLIRAKNDLKVSLEVLIVGIERIID